MKKTSKQRKSGYYWVGWSYSQDMENIVQRIAYYNERFGTWTIDGDTERYTTDRFIDVAEIPINKRRSLAFQFIYGLITALILLILLFILASVAAAFFNALTCK